MDELKVATWNFYQFAEPGTYWYERDERNDYEPDQWQAKLEWIAETLRELDADIIGFQEIFSVETCHSFLTEQGYEHFAVVDEPAIDADDDKVFRAPVVGIASRYPFKEEPTALPMPQEFRDNTQIQAEFDFRRTILRAVIETPQLGEIIFYVCHFKSQGAFVDDDAIAELSDWKTRFREHLRQRATKDADQLIRRSGEASGVYLAAMNELEEESDKAIIVLGDLNDNPQSPTLRILTQQERPHNIAGKRYSNIEDNSDKSWYYNWCLFDSFGLLADQNPAKRPVTHVASWRYPASTLDYVLVTNSLNPLNPSRKGEVMDVKIYSDHFDENKLLTSDHAPVRVTFSKKTL